MTVDLPLARRAWTRPSWLALAISLASLLIGPANTARATEPALEFLRAAQDRGYGEVAVEYLDQERVAGRLPRPLAETFDLELSRSYRIAVTEAFNAGEAEQRLAKAQSHLDKFLKEHADHPDTARAMESWGDIGLDRGLARIRQANLSKDAAQKDKLLSAARTDLEQARPRFADATARYLATYTKLRQASPGDNGKRKQAASAVAKKQRQATEAIQEAETNWLDCRFKLVKIDFYLGEAYPDLKSAQRKEALAAAAKGFDAIFQSYRESLVGLHAHMWHGRTADEMGNDTLALDIYDEVLATSPDKRERDTGLEPLFALVQYYRMRVLLRKEGSDEFLAEASEWLDAHRNWTKYDGYQGVALEAAKARLKAAEALSGEKKRTATRAAMVALGEIAKVHSEHQQEAILLRRENTKADRQDLASAKTFDEALALGDAAAENLDWAAAVAAVTRAIELKSTAKDAKQVAAADARLDQYRYQWAAAQFAAEQFAECLAGVTAVAHRQPPGPLAPRASSLAVSAALALYARAEDKATALAELEKLAQETIRQWPDKAEADDARIALGQASLVRGDLAGAIDIFERVNPRSTRYPAALHLAGQTHWRRYLSAKSKAAGDDAKPLAAERDKALEQLTASLAAQRKDAEPGKPLPRQTLETQLLLAELKAEAGDAKAAAELLDPLVEWIRAEKPNPPDNTLLRVFVAAVRAHLAIGEMAPAAATANLLVELGPDDAGIDAVANSILKMFGDSWKEAEAAAIEARTYGDPSRRTTAEAAAADRKQRVAQLLAPLAQRQHNSLAAMIYIADTAAQLGQADTARELYQAILARAEADPVFKQANANALTRIQSQLVGLLRQKGQYAEGLAQVDKLIAAFPNALEPKMEKGRLLQSWADVEPAHFSEAVAHWTMLRTRMATLARKPPEYYEVVYGAATCLFTEGMKTQDRKKALQAEQLLNATLVLSPHLSGPEMVASYKALLQKARQFQGRTGDASASK